MPAPPTPRALTRACTLSLQDQLKAFKAAGKTGFTTTQPNRAAYCTQLQNILFAEHGVAANDLDDGDSGCDGDGVVRKVRRRREDDDAEAQGGGSGSGKKRKAAQLCELNGYFWKPSEQFDIERILDRKVERRSVGKVRSRCRAPHRRTSPSPLPTLATSNLRRPLLRAG